MRTQLIALTLTLAAATAGTGVAAAAPNPASPPIVPCAGVPAANVQDAISRIAPPLPGATWRETAHGSSIDCALNWVALGTAGGTGSSPVRILFFEPSKWVGTATDQAHPFTSVVGSEAPGQVTVRFRWIVGDEPNADPQGVADVRYQIQPQAAPKPIDPLPGPIAG